MQIAWEISCGDYSYDQNCEGFKVFRLVVALLLLLPPYEQIVSDAPDASLSHNNHSSVQSRR